MSVTVINTVSKSYLSGYNRDKPYILWFGACGPSKLLVYARHLQDALDECVDYIAEHLPGLLCNEMVEEAYNEAKSRGLSDDQAYDESLCDITTGGNCGDHILSWEWGIVAEDPTPKQIADIHHER